MPITRTMYKAMNIKHKMGLLLLFFIFFAALLRAQNLPHLSFKVLKNDSLVFYLKSNSIRPIELVFPQHGNIDNTDQGIGEILKDFKVVYYPDSNYIGKDRVVLKYYGNPGSSISNWSNKKVEVDIEVVNSILNVKNDFLSLSGIAGQSIIDVLQNDNSTGDSISLVKVFNNEHCTVSITSDNKIEFIPEANFTGTAFFNYKIKDNLGSEGIGHVIINVNQSFVSGDSLKYYVTSTNHVSIITDNPGYQLIGSEPQLGQLNFTNDPEIVYTPYIDSLGFDVFKISDGNDTTVVSIKVLPSDFSSNLIVDDTAFTAKNTPITFNVTENDWDKTSYYISNYSNPAHGTLTHTGNGICTYTPNQNFTGYDQFTYTRQLNLNYYQKAKVKIFVNDFLPKTNLPYNINIPKNKAFVLNYNPPIDSTYFTAVNQPQHGVIEIYTTLDTISVNCEEITGKNLIVFTPEQDYVGNQRCELRYHSPSGSSKVVKIDFNIVDPVVDSSCYCTAYTCVWKGDTDGNGIVNIADLLPIASNAGLEGSVREDENSVWFGLNSNNWTQNTSIYDIKHVDCDGDGFISDSDPSSILENYYKIHNIYGTGYSFPAQFPINLIPDQTEVDSGDVLTLYIEVGSEFYPAKDISGLKYNIQIDPELIDSASMHHSFLPNSFLTNASTWLQLSKQPFAGQLEAAFSRINDNRITGVGVVSTCDFIIEDEIMGIKASKIKDNRYPVQIQLSDIELKTSSGQYINIPDAEATVYLRLKNNKEIINGLTVYPNPASNEVQLNLNGKEVMTNYKIYNSIGQLLNTQSIDNQSSTNISTGNFVNGMYFIEVKTSDNKSIVKKFEIIK